MIPNNRSLRPLVLAALLCGTSTASLLAQAPGGPGEHGGHHGPPPSPLFDALDANHDGVISADEIANASTSLKSLLKDGATQLTREDLRPHGPAGPERREAQEPRRGAQESPRGPAPEEADAPRPHHHPPAMHAHRPPSPDEQAADEQADAPRPHPHGLRPHLPPSPHDEEQAAPAPGRDERPRSADAQEGPGPRKGPQPEGPEGARRPHHGPPPSPLFDALDTNHDGVISDEEIGNASASLKSLLKDGATQLRREDIRPAAGLPPRPGN